MTDLTYLVGNGWIGERGESGGRVDEENIVGTGSGFSVGLFALFFIFTLLWVWNNILCV